MGGLPIHGQSFRSSITAPALFYLRASSVLLLRYSTAYVHVGVP
jgi:hypothetical protein